ncbi:MAG: PIN domain-containing protein [Polyangia bacterium]|jgi:predicted nucleic acid-binding protein
MTRSHELVFVDTGAWIALALTRDPWHERARAAWEDLLDKGARLATSVPVAIETFTFLDRNTTRDVALAWKTSLDRLAARMHLLECESHDLERAWAYFAKPELHKLSLVDATSFVLMARAKIRLAFAFDHHFASAGFRMVG